MAEDTRSILSTVKDVFNITLVSAHHCVTVQVILQQNLMGSRLQEQITWTTHLESSDRCRAAKRLLAMMRKQQVVLAGMGHSEMSTTVAHFAADSAGIYIKARCCRYTMYLLSPCHCRPCLGSGHKATPPVKNACQAPKIKQSPPSECS